MVQYMSYMYFESKLKKVAKCIRQRFRTGLYDVVKY